MIFATDWKGRKRLLLRCTQEQANHIESHMGEIPPWLVIDGVPVDGKVILEGIEFERPESGVEEGWFYP